MTDATEKPIKSWEPYRYQLVGPTENGTDSYLIVDIEAPHAETGVLGAPIATIVDGGMAARFLVDLLNRDESAFDAWLAVTLQDEPF